MSQQNDKVGLLARILELFKNPSIEKLKQEILALKEFMLSFNDVFDANFAYGFKHATVIRVKTDMPITMYREEKYGDFQINSEVAISPKSSFSGMLGYPETNGKIVAFEPEGNTGWAQVDFGNGYRKVLRYGNPSVADGVNDLILIGQPLIHETPKSIVTIILDGVTMDVLNTFKLTIEEGDTVLVSMQTRSIVSKTESIKKGVVADIEEILPDEGLIVLVNGNKVFVKKAKSVGECTRADRVLLDPSQTLATFVLPRSQSIAISSEIAPFEWDDVIGLEKPKEAIMDVINAVKYPELYKTFKKKPTAGVLLIGDPGNGKTVLGRATATKIAREFGVEEDGAIKNFVYIKASEILDMYVGEGPRKVREIFALAQQRFQETGIKTVIFIDEIDAIGKKRSNNSNDGGSGDSITNSFLMEMDGIQESYGIVVGATNRVDILDPAFLRSGRFDEIITVGRPTGDEIAKHFTLHLRNLPFVEGQTLDTMVACATEEYSSPKYALYELWFKKDGVTKNDADLAEADMDKEYFTLANLGSGAMIMGIVEKAKSEALERSIKAGGKLMPISLEDITAATRAMRDERVSVDHNDATSEYVKQKGKDVVKVKPLF